MKREDYYQWAERAARWGADYLSTLEDRPVRAQTAPGEIAAMLPGAPPESPEDMETIFADFERIVPGGMTHWQHPRFFAYFPASAAPASMIAENLTAVMAAQCMLWQTSPAATEIETRMVDWMRQALGLPQGFQGVIQDTATAANLCAVLTMRERALNWRGIDSGMTGEKRLRIYASPETHSSIDKSIRIAGIGQRNLVKAPTDGSGALDPAPLREAIADDREAGFLPAGVVLCVGGTSVGATGLCGFGTHRRDRSLDEFGAGCQYDGSRSARQGWSCNGAGYKEESIGNCTALSDDGAAISGKNPRDDRADSWIFRRGQEGVLRTRGFVRPSVSYGR